MVTHRLYIGFASVSFASREQSRYRKLLQYHRDHLISIESFLQQRSKSGIYPQFVGIVITQQEDIYKALDMESLLISQLQTHFSANHL